MRNRRDHLSNSVEISRVQQLSEWIFHKSFREIDLEIQHTRFFVETRRKNEQLPQMNPRMDEEQVFTAGEMTRVHIEEEKIDLFHASNGEVYRRNNGLDQHSFR
jgi:hypothetical protein